jgi:hypothetical protein
MFLEDRLADVTDGALMRDTRMVERKKTGRAKARKGVSHYSFKSWLKLTCTVHLGQALINFAILYIGYDTDTSCISYTSE